MGEESDWELKHQDAMTVQFLFSFGIFSHPWCFPTKQNSGKPQRPTDIIRRTQINQRRHSESKETSSRQEKPIPPPSLSPCFSSHRSSHEEPEASAVNLENDPARDLLEFASTTGDCTEVSYASFLKSAYVPRSACLNLKWRESSRSLLSDKSKAYKITHEQ